MPKGKYIVGCTGHINLSRIKSFDQEKTGKAIEQYFRTLCKENEVVLFSGFADGADLLFVEKILSCGGAVVAVLPSPEKVFAKEHKDEERFFEFLAKAGKTVVKKGYEEVAKYIVDACDELVVLWDGKELPLEGEDGKPINCGGTYHCILMASKKNIPVKFFGHE